MNVELRHLRAFVAVAETANFTRAAERLLISQPSLSYTIRQLEEQLGLQLFERTTRTTALTAVGQAFLIEARAVLDRLEQALEQAKRLASGKMGRLRVGYLIGAAVDHVPSILRAFGRRYPELEVDVIEYDFSSPAGGLDIGATDVAIVRPPLGLEKLRTRTLVTEPRVACVPERHPIARRPKVALSRLLAEPIVAAPGEGVWRDYWILTEYREKPANVVYEAATFEAELQAVALGRGLSIVPASAARLYARPGVRFIPIKGLSGCDVAVAFLDGAPPSAAHFADLAVRIVDAAAKRGARVDT
jgi:DNA-binding transcriptional LysR family regulator